MKGDPEVYGFTNLIPLWETMKPCKDRKYSCQLKLVPESGLRGHCIATSTGRRFPGMISYKRNTGGLT